jgi:hypothetical protein
MVLLQLTHNDYDDYDYDDYDDNNNDNNDEVVRTFNDDIHMESGHDKCAETALKKGNSVHLQNLILDFTEKYSSSNSGKHTSTWGLKNVRTHNIK